MSPIKFNELSDLRQTFDGREDQSDILNEIQRENPFNSTKSLKATAKDQSEGMDNDVHSLSFYTLLKSL